MEKNIACCKVKKGLRVSEQFLRECYLTKKIRKGGSYQEIAVRLRHSVESLFNFFQKTRRSVFTECFQKYRCTVFSVDIIKNKPIFLLGNRGKPILTILPSKFAIALLHIIQVRLCLERDRVFPYKSGSGSIFHNCSPQLKGLAIKVIEFGKNRPHIIPSSFCLRFQQKGVCQHAKLLCRS